MNTCLLIVDVQNGFISENTSHVIKRIQDLLRSDIFDYVVFTKFSNLVNSPYRNFLNWNKLSTLEEQCTIKEIEPFVKIVFHKNVYTGVNEETLEFIKKQQITSVFILGIDTDCCVLITAVDLFQNNIRPFVLEYYSASNGGEESHKSAITVLNRLIGKKHIIKNKIDADRIKKILAEIDI